mgnify:CR=1 FL=1
MLLKTRGIIFRALKYSETSFITDIYTEEKGLRSYIISGVRKKKARVRASLLQVMTLVDLVVYHRDDKSLSRIKEIKAARVYQSIPFDVTRGAIGLFMVEVARKTISESEENQALFHFLFETFSFLDRTEQSVANIHLCFMARFSLFLGFYPEVDCEAEASYFDLQEGVFTTQPPGHTWFLNPDESDIWAALLVTEYADCHRLPLSREVRRQLLRHQLLYYRLHIENFPTINAHQILEEVLG